MNHDDITAFRAGPALVAPARADASAHPLRRRWRRRWLPAALVAALLGAVALAVLAALATAATGPGFHLHIDGDTVELAGWEDAHSVVAVGLALASVVAVLVALPLLLMSVLLVVACAVCVALAAVVAAAGLALSPLLLPAFVVWRLVRPRTRRGAT